MRGGKHLAAWVAATTLLALAAVVGINAVDEDLSPDSVAVLAWSKSGLEDNDNMYFAAWGMRFDGEARELRVTPEVASLCDWKIQDCYAKLASATNQAGALAEKNKMLLERYAGLSSYKGYADPVAPRLTQAIPAWKDFAELATLDLLLAITEIQHSDTSAGMKRIESGAATARMVLASQENLIMRLIFASILHRYAVVLAGLARDHPDALRPERERIARILAPLAPQERALAQTLGYDFQVVHNSLQELASDDELRLQLVGETSVPPWLLLRFFQPNATTNLLSGLIAQQQRVVDLPADKLVAGLAAVQQRLDTLQASLRVPRLYNPVGRYIAGRWNGYLTPYALRLTDLDAHLRLAALAVEMNLHKPAPDAIAGLVASAGPPALDPYTGKSFQWDAAERELSTSAMEENARYARNGRFVVKL